MCRTPDVYLDIGLSPLPMTINRTHIDYAINGTKDADHFLGDNIKQLPSALKKPIAIISSKTSPQNNIIAFVDMTHNNKQVIAPVFISGGGRVNGLVIDSNVIASTYAKTNAVKNLLIDALNEEKNGKIGVFYWNKKEAIKLMASQGVPMPQGLPLADGFIHSIHEKGEIVKAADKKRAQKAQKPLDTTELGALNQILHHMNFVFESYGKIWRGGRWVIKRLSRFAIALNNYSFSTDKLTFSPLMSQDFAFAPSCA